MNRNLNDYRVYGASWCKNHQEYSGKRRYAQKSRSEKEFELFWK